MVDRVNDPLFPGLAAVLGGALLVVVGAVPFVARSYRRHGELRAGRALLAVTSTVYAMALVTYVILPLPTGDAAACAARTGVAVPQLQPLRFLDDARREAAGIGATGLLANPAVLQVLFNVALFVPLGALVRHLGRRSVVPTVLIGLGVSALVEFTQLTGVWFIYPCPYRLFDVDDLIANTTGALLGAVAAPLLRLVPGQAPRGGDRSLPRPVTVGRRLLGALCDLIGVVLVGAVLVVPLDAVLVVTGTTPVPGSPPDWAVLAEALAGTWLPWAVLFVLLPVLGLGGTAGQRAVLLRPARPDGTRPSRGLLLVRSMLGTGGFVLLQAIGGPAAAFAGLWGLVALVGLLATSGHRGLGGVWTSTVLRDRRTQPAPAGGPDDGSGVGAPPGGHSPRTSGDQLQPIFRPAEQWRHDC
jgi:glycopeptide antibiotics resistance protein